MSPLTGNANNANSPNGLTYDNGVLLLDGLQGNLTALNAANGSIITTLTPGPFETISSQGQSVSGFAPVLGGAAVDFGRIFVRTGVEGVAPGALVEYELPIMKTIDTILNNTPQQNVAYAFAHPQQFFQAAALELFIQIDNKLIDDGLWIA